MFILGKFYQGDVPADLLEGFVYNFMLMTEVEENLQTQGFEDELQSFLKLQANSGVQIDFDKILKGADTRLGGASEQEPHYGIDPDAPAPGEHTQRLYEAYAPVTYERLQALLPVIHAKISSEALKAAFQYAATEAGVVFTPLTFSIVRPDGWTPPQVA